MKVTKTTATSSETSATLDLFEGRKLPAKVKERVREEVGTFLTEQTLIAVSESKSPVQGENIPALKAGPYKKKKLDELGTGRADIQYSGETLDEFGFKPSAEGIRIGVFGSRAVVADGHNNLSGKSDLTRRRFIPGEGQSYRPGLQKEVNRIIADALTENASFKKSDFRDVTTQGELMKVLRSKLGDLTKGEMTLAVYRNEDLLDLLYSMGLHKLLP